MNQDTDTKIVLLVTIFFTTMHLNLGGKNQLQLSAIDETELLISLNLDLLGFYMMKKEVLLNFQSRMVFQGKTLMRLSCKLN